MRLRMYFQTCTRFLLYGLASLMFAPRRSAWLNQIFRPAALQNSGDEAANIRRPSILSAVSLSSSGSDERERSRTLLSIEDTLLSGMKDISANQVSTPSLSSLNRAIDQVHALFDLASFEDAGVSISSDLALSALEGLVSRVLQTVSQSDEDLCEPLRAIEALTGRVDELHVNPSIQTVESLWMIQQYQWQRTVCDIATTRDEFMTSLNITQAHHLEATVCLLRNWTYWSRSSGRLLSGRPPPVLFLLKVLQTASRYQIAMTDKLWDLTQAMFLNTTHRQHCREVHHHLLDVLSYSGPRWSHRQCLVLQSMLRRTEKDEWPNDSLIARLFVRAMRASSRAGNVVDTAWLARQLLRIGTDIAADLKIDKESINLLFLESLLHSCDAGSLLYMERLLLAKSESGFPLNSATLKMLLRKCAATRAPGSGFRAERLFYRAVNKAQTTTDWHPDYDCVHCVVEAHLLGGALLSHTRLADRFVHQYVKKFGLRLSPSTSVSNTTVGVFERVLQGYVNVKDDESGKAFRYGDELFRFFLIQHRDNRVTLEQPNARHLQLWTQLWERTNATSATFAVASFYEYERIIQCLNEKDFEPQ